MTDFLFAQPSFLTGLARLVDLGAQFTVYNVSPTPEIADARAAYADWRVVGKDLVQALQGDDAVQAHGAPEQLALDLR